MLKGCMIGAGYYARYQMEAWHRITGAQILAVAARRAGPLRTFAEECEIPAFFTDVEALLSSRDWDFVDIVTPPAAHPTLVRLAADHGVAVLCQKPFTPSLAEARRTVAYCRERGVRLMVNENWRWQAWYRELKQLLDAGRLGEPHHLRFLVRPGDGSGPAPYDHQPYFREMERFFIMETLVHHLDTSRFLMGEIERLYCVARRLNPVIAGEEFALLTLSFVGGATGLIDANRYAGSERGAAFGETVLEASERAASVAPDGSIWLTELDGFRREHPYPLPASGYRGDSCRGAQEHFVRQLESGGPFESEGEIYLRTLEAVEAAYRSAASGQAVTLPLAGGEGV